MTNLVGNPPFSLIVLWTLIRSFGDGITLVARDCLTNYSSLTDKSNLYVGISSIVCKINFWIILLTPKWNSLCKKDTTKSFLQITGGNQKPSPSDQLRRWPNAVYDVFYEGPPRKRGLPRPPDMYPSQYASAICTSRSWSVCRLIYIRAGPPIIPLQVAAYQIFAATRALRGPLLHQGSQQTRVKPSMNPKNPP